jgi:hypothetical protein
MMHTKTSSYQTHTHSPTHTIANARRQEKPQRERYRQRERKRERVQFGGWGFSAETFLAVTVIKGMSCSLPADLVKNLLK